MDFNSAHYFVQVVTYGSFTEAAKQLGVPKSTVSDKVASLEKELGVTLLMRTTRRLKLTDVGAEFFKRAQTAIQQLQGAGEEAAQSQKRPTGTLRITAPAEFTHLGLIDAIRKYSEKFPDVRLECDFSDRHVDVVGEGFDIAIRGGALKDSTLVAKRMRAGVFMLVASPAYLKTAPPLKHPRDLSNHRLIKQYTSSGEAAWPLHSTQGKTARVSAPSHVLTNSFAAIKKLVISGVGISILPDLLCRDELRGRELVRVLPDWSTADMPVHLVYPPHRFSSPKVKEMVPLLEKILREM
jgi:DNA-binding transcriptional LysR family regulator